MMNNEYKKFCFDVFKEQSSSLENVKLRILPINLMKSCGYVRPDFKKGNYTIVINSNAFKKMSVEERKIYSYITICHEIEHIKIFENTKKDTFFNFDYLMSLMEYISYLSEFSIPFDNAEIGFKSRQLMISSMKKNYIVSTEEIKCSLEGYKKAYLHSKKANEKFEIIIKSLEFLNDNMQIYYDKNILPLDKFSYYLIKVSNYIKKFPQILNEYKILNKVFNNDGSIKKIYDMYVIEDSNNSEFYNKLIISLLSTNIINEELIGNINDSKYRKYIENIIDNYINSVISYYQNIKLGTIFIEEEKILYENLKILLIRVKNLDRIVDKYSLNKKCGLIL